MRSPSTSGLVLVWLSVLSAALFAGDWRVRLRGGGAAAHQACVGAAAAATSVAGDPAASVRALLGCTDAADRRAALATLAWPVAVALLAGGGYLLFPPLIRRLRRARPADPAGPLFRLVAALSAEAGLRAHPVVEVAGHGIGSGDTPSVYGRRWPYRILVPQIMELNAVRGSARDTALLRHELAHVRARDVGRVYLTGSAWLVAAALVLPPLALDAVRHAPSAGPALSWRLLAIGALLYLALLAAVRHREHDADLASGGVPVDPATAPARRGRPRFHPSPARRAAVLRDPGRHLRPSAADAFVAGTAAGLCGTELGPLIDVILPLGPWPAYLAAAAVTAGPVLGVLGWGCWRPGAPPPGGRAPAAGAALGLGLVCGAQLAPRASADWWRVFATAGGRAAELNLGRADPASGALIVAAAVAIGALIGLWCASVARACPTDGGWGTAALAGGAAVLAVPLGTWLLLVRLAAGSGWPPTPLLWAGVAPYRRALLVAAAAGWAFVALGAVRRRRRAGPAAPRRPSPLVPAAALAWLLAAGLLAALPGLATADPRPPGPARPLPRPSTAQGGYACLWWQLSGPAARPGGDEDQTRALGRYLAGTDDAALRDIGRTLLLAADRHDADLAATAVRGLDRRCDLLLRYGVAPSRGSGR
ncbi:hypothetical protein [Dactylosporangium sp. CA-092794]|uniref:hypothetical protein n=1 Tax=Dactylosporangium sp. CA-092794 TaxID=3239929 RepID=UPI003D90489D